MSFSPIVVVVLKMFHEHACFDNMAGIKLCSVSLSFCFAAGSEPRTDYPGLSSVLLQCRILNFLVVKSSRANHLCSKHSRLWECWIHAGDHCSIHVGDPCINWPSVPQQW
ncbi:hypothetical protein V6N13_045993 [Hibiscus sabdariffa]